MSSFWPPLENLPTFDVTVFRDAQDVVEYAVESGITNNIAGGTAGDLLYQSAPSTTAKLPIGANTFILSSNGSIPVWTAPSAGPTPTLSAVLVAGNSAGSTSINMNSNAISAVSTLGVNSTSTFGDTVSINIAALGVAKVGLNIQDTTLANNIRFIPSNTSGNLSPFANPGASAIVALNGTVGNQSLEIYPWSNTTVGIRLTGTSALIGAGGVASFTPTSSISFAGTSATMTGNLNMGTGSITNATAITATTFNGALNGTASLATNISLGTAGDLLYQSASNVTAKLGIGANTYFLTSNGTAPVWTAPTTPTISTTQTTTQPYYLVGSINQTTSSDSTLYKSSVLDGVYVNPATNTLFSGELVVLNSNSSAFNFSFFTPTSDDFVLYNSAYTAFVANQTIFYNIDAGGAQRTILTLNGDPGASTFDGLALKSTTVAVADNNTSTTMYPIFTTAVAGQKSLLFDSTTTPLRYKPDTSELSALRFTVNGLNPVAGDNAGLLQQNTGASATVIQNQATSGQIHLTVRDVLNIASIPLKVSSDDVSVTRFSVGGIVNPVVGNNAGVFLQNTGAFATTIQNQATSGLIRLNTLNALNAVITTFQISTTDLTTITTNCPTITGFAAPATSDNTSKIATTSWVQSALTSGVATATTVAVADNDSATTMYPVFTTAVAGQKSLLFDSTTTPLRYKPDTSELSALRFTVNGLNPAAGTNAGYIEQITASSATVIQNQATSGLIRLSTRDAANLPTTPLQISFANCNITTTNDPVIYARNILVDNGSTNPITIGNGSSTSTSNIIITSLSLASTRVFTVGGNVIIGSVAGNSLPVGATDNTFVGDAAGGVTTGSNNICIGYNSQVPTVASSNQIAIGTAAETMYVRGGFNWRVGTQITASINLSAVVLAQFYTVAMAAATQTITLPNPTTAAYLGATVTFKRKTNTTVFSIAAAGVTPFLLISSITLTTSPISIAATVFQVDMICDGTNWCIIGQS